MNHSRFISFFLAAAALAAVACGGKDEPENPWDNIKDPETEDTSAMKEPLTPKYRVVAHRGGSAEVGTTANPDNSIAALRYAMSLGCYGSECDIYWTKDNKIVVAHADGECKINGMHPWEHTASEIRAAAKLSNGETIPLLEEFLQVVMEDGSCTKLILDIKNITSPSTLTQYPINATKRACEIIKEKKAQKFCEFICTGNSTVGTAAIGFTLGIGCPNGWMANSAPSVYVGKGFSWANLSTDYITPYGTGSRTIDEFLKAGLQISVFNVDRTASTEFVEYYVSRYGDLKFICTNYPKWMIEKLAQAGN